MPKLVVSDAKGLVQSAGSGTLSGHKKVVEDITVARTLTAADSGKVFTVDADSGSYAITLPTDSASLLGWNAIFVLADVHATNDVTIVRGDTDNDAIVGNVVNENQGGAADGLTISGNVITFDASGDDAVGDLVEVFCYASSATATSFVAQAYVAS